MELSKYILTSSVGRFAYNKKGETMGYIEEVTQNSKEELQYIILSSNHFFGRGSRYFAIPICAAFINIKNDGKIVLNAGEDDLQFARGVNFKRCPNVRANSFYHSIYEVYQYKPSSTPSKRRKSLA